MNSQHEKDLAMVNALYPNGIDRDEWDAIMIDRLAKKYPNGLLPPVKEPATIDRNGFRHVWCVENSRGARRYFNSSKDAIELEKTSQYQPCRIVQMPIYPRWEWHDTPIAELAKLIEIELAK